MYCPLVVAPPTPTLTSSTDFRLTNNFGHVVSDEKKIFAKVVLKRGMVVYGGSYCSYGPYCSY